MAPYTNECKQSGPITSSSSKPIFNEDLAEVLTLSQKGPLPEWKLSSFDGKPLWLVESTSTRGHYPLAHIMSLNYVKDNTACSANLRTVSGNYTRPLVKLVPVLAPSGAEYVNAI